jgi:hypothetical protein
MLLSTVKAMEDSLNLLKLNGISRPSEKLVNILKIEIAYSFEKLTNHRRLPENTPNIQN